MLHLSLTKPVWCMSVNGKISALLFGTNSAEAPPTFHSEPISSNCVFLQMIDQSTCGWLVRTCRKATSHWANSSLMNWSDITTTATAAPTTTTTTITTTTTTQMRAKHQPQVSIVEVLAAPWGGSRWAFFMLTLPSFLFGVFRKRDDAANVQQHREEDH